MKRVLLDQGLAPAAAGLLRDGGWDAVHVAEIALDRADDETILRAAALDNRVCVTLDHDFHAHLALAGDGKPSVVFLRIQGVGAETQADLIQRIWLRCEDALDRGAAVSADLRDIRMRRLPLR
jgi:predicted nuclease of predicted toxin-antitoxin system